MEKQVNAETMGNTPETRQEVSVNELPPEIPTTEQISNINSQIGVYSAGAENDRQRINEVRTKLGLIDETEEALSILAQKEEGRKLQEQKVREEYKPESTEVKSEEPGLDEIDLPPIAEWEISKDVKGDTCQFFDVPGHPELLGRKMDFMPDDKPELSRSEAKEYWKKCISEFQKIVSRYGMRIPKTRFVFNDDETSGKPSFFAVTERINGESLNKIPTFDKRAAKELDIMYTGILSHVKESYLEDGYVWGDFAANQQIMYGTEPNGNKLGVEEPHPYLIDVEPRVSLWKDMVDPQENRSLEEKKEHAFWQSFSYTVFEMADTELKTERGRKSFAKSREALAKVVKELPEPKGQDTKDIRLKVLGEV